MKIISQLDGSVLRIGLSDGEILDGRATRRLQEEVMGRLGMGDHLIVSLNSVRGVDSAGIGALISILSVVRRRGGRMALVEVAPQIALALQATKLSSIFEIYADEAAALSELAPCAVTSEDAGRDPVR